jgi:hypothetical protein
MALGVKPYNLEDDEARLLDECGKILSPTRGHVVKNILRIEEVTRSVPGISKDVCVPLARRGRRAKKLDPQNSGSTEIVSSRGGYTWSSSAPMSWW